MDNNFNNRNYTRDFLVTSINRNFADQIDLSLVGHKNSFKCVVNKFDAFDPLHRLILDMNEHLPMI